MTNPPVSICLLVYGDFSDLARQALDSFREHCSRSLYRLIVGANAVSPATLDLLKTRRQAGEIDHLIVSNENLNKCPMMRRMFEQVETDFIWWFDDDSYVLQPGTLERWLDIVAASGPEVAMWGPLAVCGHPRVFAPDVEDVPGFIRGAPWYRGLPLPSWKPGGKGEFNYKGLGIGDGRWFFILGGCSMMRTASIRAMDWPDRRLIKMGEDVFLGEAMRQQGWGLENIDCLGVAVNTEDRRGSAGFLPGSIEDTLEQSSGMLATFVGCEFARGESAPGAAHVKIAP